MDFLMNGLLLAATCFAGAYCWVLSRRVRDLKSLDTGLGGAIVTLTRQVELARITLEEARSSSSETKLELSRMVERADAAAKHLRLLIAAAPHAAPYRPEPALAPAPSGTPAAHASDPAPAQPAEALPEPRIARREPLLTAGGAEPVATAEVRTSGPMPSPATPAAPQSRLAPRPVEPTMSLVESNTTEDDPDRQREIPTLDRLMAGPLVRPPAHPPAEPARPAAAHLVEVPKPRALAPIENPLRRLRAATKPAPPEAPRAAPPTGESEDALLEALSALAGGR